MKQEIQRRFLYSQTSAQSPTPTKKGPGARPEGEKPQSGIACKVVGMYEDAGTKAEHAGVQ
jgi:hypothetical protein